MIFKRDLSYRLEPSILNKMSGDCYEVEWVAPGQLVTWNRLDIGMRISYLDLIDRVADLADNIYYQDLRAQTLGSLIDPDNSSKFNFDVFKKIFTEISREIMLSGFDEEKSLLPIATNGSILNGGHRLSAALFHGKDVAYVQTLLPSIVCDYRYFYERAVSTSIIEMSVLQLLKYASNTHVAFLWPSGKSKISETEKLFKNIVYKKKLTFTDQGALNLLFQCYQHMDWIGEEDSGYSGLHQKLYECFPSDKIVTFIIFQEGSGPDQVKLLKQRIRDINGIGFSSVHITDTKEEVLRIANLLCNDNGVHYLNNAKLIKRKHILRIAGLFEQARRAKVDPDSFTVDGSYLLELYGIRQEDGLDVLAASCCDSVYALLGFNGRTKQLCYHNKAANEIVYNPENHFSLFGVKFVGFPQLIAMKVSRGGGKDINDLRLASAVTDKRCMSALRARIEQNLLYLRIRAKHNFFKYAAAPLKSIGLYGAVRRIYRYLRLVPS